MDKKEEARLRELIRKELENREALKGLADAADERDYVPGGMSEERARIIEEEIRKFHTERGKAREYVNDEGDVEWLTEAEILERGKQLPVDMEELEIGQKHVRNRVMMLSLLLFVALVLMFVALREKTGSVQVICNVPKATIYLNGSATEYLSDYTLKGLPGGSHLISVFRPGYVANGAANARVRIVPGSEEIVILKLKPSPPRHTIEQAKD
ncbi:MAG: hypothetical protein ABIA75_06780 [Candidatus Neomarinimicrobiota bacterium]